MGNIKNMKRSGLPGVHHPVHGTHHSGKDKGEHLVPALVSIPVTVFHVTATPGYVHSPAALAL